eukprot:TRINITY_DN22216_c0_g1_i1.p1 TRINITY_DN22216_c0_g1~~TRINITY_DN22216_c0_g1_i1.p1  ORF type:complete len:235 (+),score=52.63 TRINITY_DN22216_c0_g1_i1:120-824(+)
MSNEAQFYAGQLVLAIEHFHSQNIIYRDLKPENVMVDAKGYVKLIDMGTAKIMKTRASKTFTIIGTPHYMAPEVLKGKGYTMNVDLWSIGICLYEFLCGAVPFGEEAEDPYAIYEEIIKNELKFPHFMKDKKARRFIEQLLSKVPEQRLGTSFAALKANPWFDNFDWDDLLEKKMIAPWKPQKDLVISDAEISKKENQKKLVIDVIRAELSNDSKGRSGKKKRKSVEEDWDCDF